MTSRFRLPQPTGHDRVEEILHGVWPYAAEPVEVEHRAYFDTFDWRLHERSLALYYSAGNLVLCPLTSSDRELVADAPNPPRFASDLPHGTMRDRLQGITEVRALLHLTDIDLASRSYRVLNDDDKTVARLEYIEAGWRSAPPAGSSEAADDDPGERAAFLTVRPVRGYAKAAREVVTLLTALDVTPSRESDALHAALEAVGRTPRDYTGKLDLDLDADMRSADALRQIMRELLRTMRANQAGAIADIDTEFLHDLRISIRRTRSALGQIPLVFPADDTNRFALRFRQVFRRTNLLRDLDVYLMAESTYRDMLPPAMHDDIAPLFDYLRSQRAVAHREVVATLESAEYAELLDDWEAFLEHPTGADEPDNADMMVGELAGKRIHKRFRRIVRDGRDVLEHTDDELLHALRLECKKLRYLLEFFSSLYPQKPVARLIKQLKRLQDNLGEFVDLSVQQSFLLGTADEMPLTDAGSRRALVATGFLVETMARRQQAVKAEFADRFREFASTDNQRVVATLCAARVERPSP